ncbi:MAG TPA: S-formylglutathione hydrolase [Bacteriovoracaceae bacterium]|nr:S-formylglutathione hydrolase [Bacteriovoracaceae bacterium]
MKNLKTHKTFDGSTQFWSHASASTGTEMKFSTFIPTGEVRGCLMWLSGLTCTEENFITKAGAQRSLAEHQLMVICPDTSPRGLDLPGEHDAYDFGSGASFYLDATTPGYADHYRMESYLTQELYSLIQKEFNVPNISLLGHSMGGHGALTLGLRHPEKFKSLSAFSPIAHPSVIPWGVKAFTGYLGTEQRFWKEHDACELLKSGKTHPVPILVHQGLADEYFEKELRTEDLRVGVQQFEIRYVEGYDHSYYFISSFIEAHVKHHAKFL